MKLTKKQELALALADYKECISIKQLFQPEFANEWAYSLWTCKWPHDAGQVTNCHGGEPNRYWFDKRICASELRGCVQLDPTCEHIVLVRGGKRPQYTILDANKYRTLVAA
jgi:hypothetical protein